ncbi:hypothetical protein niasHS_013891 [Heterodera schachtii]|uniref:Ribosome-recycling factor, mitochondrial n=1 Tax=Heterodera schachtii TaxID=97005 RepID=A0ABD2IHI0_HETSC
MHSITLFSHQSVRYFCHLLSRPQICFCQRIVERRQQFSTTHCLLNNKIKKEKRERKAAATDFAVLKATISSGKNKLAGKVEEDNDDEDGEDENGGKMPKNSKSSDSSKGPQNVAAEAVQEMEQYFKALNDALAKHLSLKVNLKAYEDLSVTLENGETHRLIKFARISLKTPNGPIVLNFADNPAAIKPARIAIQNMAENVTPQVDGIIIHVPIPKLTRERREALAEHSANLVLNEFKLALNEVFKKYTKLLERSSNNKEMVQRLNNGLLAQKRHWDKMGEDKVKERRQMLLKEIEF